ncbi:hypothetical protein [Viridibacterium curvum]|uniref:Uncharacterized protein n=1 Tax=Viridibacterium curvum TaxID=1101404 RepID=A0ABP9R962_9RHOO
MLELKSFRFDYQRSADEAARSLSHEIEQSEQNDIEAVITPEAVKLVPVSPWWERRNITPVFVAKFERTAAGCTLVGRFRPAWIDLAFMAFFYCFFFFMFAEEGEILFTIGFLGLSAFVFFMLWATQSNKRKNILNAIARSI